MGSITKNNSGIQYNFSDNIHNCIEIPAKLVQVNNSNSGKLLHSKDLEWDYVLDKIKLINSDHISEYCNIPKNLVDYKIEENRYYNDEDLDHSNGTDTSLKNKPNWYFDVDQMGEKICRVHSTQETLDIVNFLIGRCVYLDEQVSDLLDKLNLKNVKLTFFEDLDKNGDGQPEDIHVYIYPLLEDNRTSFDEPLINKSLQKEYVITTTPETTDSAFSIGLNITYDANWLLENEKIVVNVIRKNLTNMEAANDGALFEFILLLNGFNQLYNKYNGTIIVHSNKTAITNSVEPKQFNYIIEKTPNKIKSVIINDQEYMYFGPLEIFDQIKQDPDETLENKSTNPLFWPCLILRNTLINDCSNTVKYDNENDKYIFVNNINQFDASIIGSYEWLLNNNLIFYNNPKITSPDNLNAIKIGNGGGLLYKIEIVMDYTNKNCCCIKDALDNTPIKYYLTTNYNKTLNSSSKSKTILHNILVYNQLYGENIGERYEINNNNNGSNCSTVSPGKYNIYSIKLLYKNSDYYDVVKYAKYADNNTWYKCNDKLGLSVSSEPIYTNNSKKYKGVEVYNINDYEKIYYKDKFAFILKPIYEAGDNEKIVALTFETSGTRYIGKNEFNTGQYSVTEYENFPLSLKFEIDDIQDLILVEKNDLYDSINNYDEYASDDFPTINKITDNGQILINDKKINAAININIPIISKRSFGPNEEWTNIKNFINKQINNSKIILYTNRQIVNDDESHRNKVLSRLFNLTYDANLEKGSNIGNIYKTFKKYDDNNIFNYNINIDYELTWLYYNTYKSNDSFNNADFNGINIKMIELNELYTCADIKKDNFDKLSDKEKGKILVETFIVFETNKHQALNIVQDKLLKCKRITSIDHQQYVFDCESDPYKFFIPIVFNIPEKTSGLNPLYNEFNFVMNLSIKRGSNELRCVTFDNKIPSFYTLDTHLYTPTATTGNDSNTGKALLDHKYNKIIDYNLLDFSVNELESNTKLSILTRNDLNTLTSVTNNIKKKGPKIKFGYELDYDNLLAGFKNIYENLTFGSSEQNLSNYAYITINNYNDISLLNETLYFTGIYKSNYTDKWFPGENISISGELPFIITSDSLIYGDCYGQKISGKKGLSLEVHKPQNIDDYTKNLLNYSTDVENYFKATKTFFRNTGSNQHDIVYMTILGKKHSVGINNNDKYDWFKLTSDKFTINLKKFFNSYFDYYIHLKDDLSKNIFASTITTIYSNNYEEGVINLELNIDAIKNIGNAAGISTNIDEDDHNVIIEADLLPDKTRIIIYIVMHETMTNTTKLYVLCILCAQY